MPPSRWSFYGSAPAVSVTNTTALADQQQVGQGRLLPTTAVDQYAPTLTKWFGVADSEMASILPNLSRFGLAAGRRGLPDEFWVYGVRGWEPLIGKPSRGLNRLFKDFERQICR